MKTAKSTYPANLLILGILVQTTAFATPHCPGGAVPFEGTGRGATESKARENANLDIASLFSTIKVNILDELTQRETSSDIKEYANYQRKIKVESGLYSGYVKDTEYPYPKEGNQYVAKRYLCPADAAKPYLDSLKSINQRVSIQKLSNSFCEALYKTYSPRVILFERILDRLGEMDEARIADYKRVEKECDDMRGYIKKGYVGFEEALDKAVAEIVSKRGKVKTKIVIAEIYASPSQLKDFITAELESKLVKVKNFSVEPANENAISGEQSFKMGPMKYADAMEMGRYSKANVVLVGSFDPYAGFSYFKLKALDVQPPPKTIAMHTDKVRPDEAELADLITGKLTAITDDALAYLSKGEDLYREGRYDEAIRELDRALAMNENLADGYFIRGTAYALKGNLDRAIEDYNAVLSIKPDDYETLYNRGVAYVRKGDFNQAIEDWTAALRIKPDFHEALYNRGRAYYDKGNLDWAIEDYTAALRIKPDYQDALNNRGVAYKNKGNYDRAIEDWTAALRIKLDFHEALHNRGNAYANKGNYDRAIEDWTATLRIKPDKYEALGNRGFAYYYKGNLDRAIEDYNAALRIKPDYPETLYNRGNAYADKGNYDLAIKDYTAVLRIKPDDHEALLKRGLVYRKKGNLDRAIEDYNAALKIKPDYPEALSTRGIAYYYKGNIDRAIEDFEAVLRIDPNYANAREALEMVRKEKAKANKLGDYEALYNHGNAYADKGDLDRAIEYYNAALKIKPDYYEALYNRGIAYKDKGNIDRAIEDYTATIRIKPDLYQALINRGNAYRDKGNIDRAIEDYNAALRLKPDYQGALLNRGVAYYKKGNLDRAIEDFEAVLRIDTNNANARKGLEMARQEKAKANSSNNTYAPKSQGDDFFTDNRDGKKYRMVKIGKQTWMAENLNYEATGSRCNGNQESNCQKYGRLYNWATAKIVCPIGWHLPNKAEWEVLTATVGGAKTGGKYLKAKSGWNSNGNGTDAYGFAALPGGMFGISVGNNGYWWSSSEISSDAYYRYMGYSYEDVYGDYCDKSLVFSVRCIQDN